MALEEKLHTLIKTINEEAKEKYVLTFDKGIEDGMEFISVNHSDFPVNCFNRCFGSNMISENPLYVKLDEGDYELMYQYTNDWYNRTKTIK